MVVGNWKNRRWLRLLLDICNDGLEVAGSWCCFSAVAKNAVMRCLWTGSCWMSLFKFTNKSLIWNKTPCSENASWQSYILFPPLSYHLANWILGHVASDWPTFAAMMDDDGLVQLAMAVQTAILFIKNTLGILYICHFHPFTYNSSELQKSFYYHHGFFWSFGVQRNGRATLVHLPVLQHQVTLETYGHLGSDGSSRYQRILDFAESPVFYCLPKH